MFCCFLSWNITVSVPTLKDIKGQDVLVDDYPETTYRLAFYRSTTSYSTSNFSYTGFHLIYACAAQYMMMTITGWLNAFRHESLEDRYKVSNPKSNQSKILV